MIFRYGSAVNEITFTSKRFFDDCADHQDPPAFAGASAGKHVHLILIATKPDIIKQIPLYRELKKRGHCVVLGHTGQHYSENLSGGMLKEFGVEPDFNLNVRGEMHEVVSQIIGRLGWIIGELKKPTYAKATAGRRGKIVIPYVHGDTTTAMAAANAGYCHMFASVHVEAGIRTLTPAYEEWQMANGKWEMKNIEQWRQFLMDRKNWQRGSLEPYPEQFNTRSAETATGIHLAPVELDREFLLSEGFPEDRISVVGNSVVDAIAETERAEKAGRAGRSDIFERYPLLAKGNFVRFCIHRRENCLSEKRFRAIYGALKALVEEGRTVLLISMFQTEAAFDRFNLRKDVEALAKAHPNFLYSPVWPEYRDVIAAMGKAAVCATDSGSMQEEMNAMGIPCVTLRFGSDRSESVMCGGNLIAPPIDAALLQAIITYAWGNRNMARAPKIYGKDVSKKSIDAVEKILTTGEVFRTEEERLGL